MATASRKARKRAGERLVRAPKIPTPIERRSHSWRSRWNPKRNRTEVRPTRLAVVRYGIPDLGWLTSSRYFKRDGSLRKWVRQ